MSDMTASGLAQALAAVQADLPRIVKGETADVPTKNGGSYSYTYADLASISAAILPLLATNNLAFIAKPTVTDTGAFVLAYSLIHGSGEREDGSYPLPSNGTPQQVGSAITYARRYVLCAVTGVAPDDDDGRAAEQAHQQASAPPEDGQLAMVRDLLDQLDELGAPADRDKSLDYAAVSAANADQTVRVLQQRVRQAMDDQDADFEDAKHRAMGAPS